MRTLMPLLASLMLVLASWTGIAHASENGLCVDMPRAEMTAHADADCARMLSDTSKPSDAGKGYPCHGSACHVHHVAAPADMGMAVAGDLAPAIHLPHQPRIDLTRRGYPAMRPPQA